MSRDYVKPVFEQPFSASGMFTLSPNASTVRYPTDADSSFVKDTTVGGLVDCFLIRNKSGVQIRVVIDDDADVSTGEIVDPGENYTLPRRSAGYISIYGGDGTAIRVHWYRV